MTKQKDLKRRVRGRMQKTGESYTSARAKLIAKKRAGASSTGRLRANATAGLASAVLGAKSNVGSAARAKPSARSTIGKEPAGHVKTTGMSDAAVRKKTGRTWVEWVAVMDGFGAAKMEHQPIAAKLLKDFGIDGWWAQMITVGYERIRGLRAKGQRRNGSWECNKSKIYPVPVATLFAAFEEPARRRWLGNVKIGVRKSTLGKSLRWRFEDDTPIEVNFYAKGSGKSQAQLQHREHASKERADELRAFWTERFAALGAYLARG